MLSHLVHDAIELVGGDSWGDRLRDRVHRLAREFAHDAHRLEVFIAQNLK